MKITLKKTLLFSLLLGLLLGGCGFKLRGTGVQLSKKFEKTYVLENEAANSDFLARLSNMITLNGATLVSKEQSTLTIAITPIRVSARQIALSDSGAQKEYENTYTTTITVIDSKNDIELGRRELSSVHLLQLDDRLVLSDAQSSANVRKDAERDLIQSALIYLQSF